MTQTDSLGTTALTKLTLLVKLPDDGVQVGVLESHVTASHRHRGRVEAVQSEGAEEGVEGAGRGARGAAAARRPRAVVDNSNNR